MFAALHGGSLAERDDRDGSDALARLVHRANVIALVECCGLGAKLALPHALQEIVDEARFVRSRRRYTPRDGKLGPSANGKVQLPTVETTALASRDSGAVT
jgi:hypothetical protein